ncbi:hypothetical protein SRHO_G00300830 [Serrasalmus rhombeus]
MNHCKAQCNQSKNNVVFRTRYRLVFDKRFLVDDHKDQWCFIEWRFAVAERHWQPAVQLVRNMSIMNLRAVGGVKTQGKDARKSDNNAQVGVV